ncbi:hypothetical protein [Campylobacter aviculae]|uniref:Uncharacterized protein n=1 Tax=Campylobacter aviculae TaxID=2510190 RepID=A0A4U7BKS1_9BACT|nr:hypothetical protein [Campylobacter aviculae]TKX32583.1 hypothetical protein CQA76_02890 [Campylobacter aviculae]
MITLAIKKGTWVYVYSGEKQLYSIYCDKDDEIMGFTGFSVSIKKGKFIHTYDEKGHEVSSLLID